MDKRRMDRFLLIALLLTGATAHADTMYVNDKLVVNVYAEADQASQKVDTIETGAATEVLDRTDGGFAHVHLSNGHEGYVRLSYLSAQAPAVVRLKELEASQGSGALATTDAAPSRELAKLQERNTALETELAAQKNKPAVTCPESKPAVVATPAACTSTATPPPVYVGMSPITSSGLAFVGVIIGFALGYRWLAARIRKKYQGLKIY
jgi:Bacterial SH3 domain